MIFSDIAGRRVADSLIGNLPKVLVQYEDALQRIGSVILADPRSRQQCLKQAENVLNDICTALREAPPVLDPATWKLDPVDLALSQNVGKARAQSGIHPVESLRASSILLEVMVAAVAVAVTEDPDALGILAVSTRAAHHSIMVRISGAASAYSSFLLDRVHQAHLEERARIGRELHDRLGSGISAAVRLVEQCRSGLEGAAGNAQSKIAQTEAVLRQAVDDVRRTALELRLKSETEGLEKALRSSIEAICPDETVTVVDVVGDETWAPPIVLDELFLVLREAMRNAYAHAQPKHVAARVEIAPHEVRAVVEDDGIGFDPEQPSKGVGVAAMRERVALLGGVVDIFSRPLKGSSVQVRVPLSGGVNAR
jgi:signal transduction histidine kinase